MLSQILDAVSVIVCLPNCTHTCTLALGYRVVGAQLVVLRASTLQVQKHFWTSPSLC